MDLTPFGEAILATPKAPPPSILSDQRFGRIGHESARSVLDEPSTITNPAMRLVAAISYQRESARMYAYARARYASYVGLP